MYDTVFYLILLFYICLCQDRFLLLLSVISQGAIQGPEEFAEGMVLGVRSLFGHAVGRLTWRAIVLHRIIYN